MVLRRLYTPEQFGAYAVYTSLIAILFTLASGRYNRTIMLPKSDKDALYLISLSSLIVLVFSLLTFTVLLFYDNQIACLLNLSSSYRYTIWFVPVGLFLYSLFDIFNYWLLRKKAFNSSGSAKVIRRSSDGLTQTILGNANINLGLWFGEITGQFVNFIYVVIQSFRKGFTFRGIQYFGMIQMAKRYKDFPKYNLLPALLNSISLMAPVIIINKLFSQEITGYFDLTRLVLALPLALVVQSLYQVILQRSSEKRNERQSMKGELARSFYLLLIGTIVMIIVILLFANLIFGLFGEEWDKSSEFARILVFSFAIKLLISPYSALFTSLEKIKIGSIWQIGNFAIIVILFFLDGIPIEDFLHIFMWLEVVSYLIYGVLIWYILMKYERSLGFE